MELLPFLIIGAYLLQIVELTFLPLPSETSTWEIMKQKTNSEGTGEPPHQLLKPATSLLGTILSVGAFCLPAFFLIFPEIYQTLGPIEILRTEVVRWIAAPLIILASVCTLIAVLTLVSHRRGDHDDVAASLCHQGLFGKTRNPVTLGLILLITGFFLSFPSWGMLAGVVVYIINAHVRVVAEEHLLAREYGREYRRYREEVPRYLVK